MPDFDNVILDHEKELTDSLGVIHILQAGDVFTYRLTNGYTTGLSRIVVKEIGRDEGKIVMRIDLTDAGEESVSLDRYWLRSLQGLVHHDDIADFRKENNELR